METPRCKGKTKTGRSCKNAEGKCRFHSPSSSGSGGAPKSPTTSSDSPKRSVIKKIKRGSSPKKTLEKNYRGLDQKLCYDDLGFRCDLALDYEKTLESPEQRTSSVLSWNNITSLVWGEREDVSSSITYPKEFRIVAQHLMDICKTAPGGKCIIHPLTPAIQWDNERADKRAIDQILHAKGNHYFHDWRSAPTDAVKIFGKEDMLRCKCNSQHTMIKEAAQTLLLHLNGDEDEWTSLHGYVIGKEGPVDRNGTGKVSKVLREKIIQDSVEFLAQEYKIHLQPKPEYQISVLKELVKLLKNTTFNENVLSWKAIIPYSRVLGEINLPAIVIYPTLGLRSAQIVAETIVNHFSKFDAAEIGLNHTPRFNYKYNELIYWAGGSGDHKKVLPSTYFTKDKMFYKNHELKL